MGSATSVALASSQAALAGLGETVSLTTAEELFSAGRVIAESAPLRAVIGDPMANAADKETLIDRVFGGSMSAETRGLLKAVGAARWSEQDDVLEAIENLGIRAAAMSAPASVSIEKELFAFGQAVGSDSDLELALGSKLGQTSSKLELVDRLLADKVSPQTLAIVRHLIGQPRGRRIRTLIRYASNVVADVAGLMVATVTSAQPLTSEQRDRLQGKLAAQYGQQLQLNTRIDPTVIGGVRVQVGDDVIDGSIASRINDLKLQLQR